MRDIKDIIGMLTGVKSCLEQLKVSGRTDCAIIIASCNTLDDIAAKLSGGEGEK